MSDNSRYVKLAALRWLLGWAQIVDGVYRLVTLRTLGLNLRVAKAIARERGRRDAR